MLPESLMRKFVDWIEEDAPDGDETGRTLVDADIEARAVVIAKGEGLLAGMDEMSQVLLGLGFRVIERKENGTRFRPGERLVVVEGNARKILAVERTLLNVLSHCSGIATTTRRLVDEAKNSNPKVRVSATRKTLPGMRFLEKEAVRVGGGDTHRLSLSQTPLVKDNHLKIVKDVKGAVARVREKTSFVNNIEVEASNAEEAIEAVIAGADIVMLDNFAPEQVDSTLRSLEERGLRESVKIEVSGGVDERNIGVYASKNVDVISTGKMTNSAGIVDMSLEIEDSWKKNA